MEDNSRGIEKAKYFSFGLSIDCVIFGFDHGKLKILLIKRNEEPFINTWALPGNLVAVDEDLNGAARMILKEISGLDSVFLEQVKTFGEIDRHPIGRVITTAYFALINSENLELHPGSLAEKAEWVALEDVRQLAFDHNNILQACVNHLRKSIRNKPIGFELLPQKFTLSELQDLYEAIIRQKLDKRNFRKKILSMNILIDNKEQQMKVAHRPARLYEFDEERYKVFLNEGFVFDL